jgi:hypothetical protein
MCVSPFAPFCTNVTQNPPGRVKVGVNALVTRLGQLLEMPKLAHHPADFKVFGKLHMPILVTVLAAPESWRVSLNGGAAVMAKFCMCFRKKLQSLCTYNTQIHS